MKMIKCIEVEWDEDYRGSAPYDGIGSSAYVPISLLEKQTGDINDKVAKAFKKHTGHDPIHIIIFVPGLYCDQDGDSWDDHEIKNLLYDLFLRYTEFTEDGLAFYRPCELRANIVSTLPRKRGRLGQDLREVEFSALLSDNILHVHIIETTDSDFNHGVEKDTIVNRRWDLNDPESIKDMHECLKKVLRDYFKQQVFGLALERKKYEKLIGKL